MVLRQPENPDFTQILQKPSAGGSFPIPNENIRISKPHFPQKTVFALSLLVRWTAKRKILMKKNQQIHCFFLY